MQRTWRLAPVIVATIFATGMIAAPAAFSRGAYAAEQEYAPQVGQEGKDVIWVPTPQSLVERMLDMAKLTAKDIHYDLGSGDGRTVIAAAKRGAQAVGVEYNPDMVALSQRNAKEAGVADRAIFRKADIFETDFSKAQVITMFLLPSINMKLRPKILDLKPGTRIVSNSFDMEDWQPDETANVNEDCTSWCRAMLWIVPAKVAGTWQTSGGDLVLQQSFQMVTGTLGGKPIADGKLHGDQLTFTVGGAKWTGRVNGSAITGSVTGGGISSFTATKK